MVGPTLWRENCRPSRNGGFELKFGGSWKIQDYLEAQLELIFFIKTLSFIVEGHLHAPL
jgi:hypothetical protein